MKTAAYIIEMVGLASDSIGNVTIDGQVALVQIHDTYSVGLAPFEKHPRTTYQEALFYADCLSYDHDTPTLVRPKRSAFYEHGYSFSSESTQKRLTYEWYFQDMTAALEMVRAIRQGATSWVEFRWPGIDQRIDLAYMQKYTNAAKELHLYAAALRQLDPLSEYLCYYRVLESAHGGNAKTWVKHNLCRLERHNFGSLAYGRGWESAQDAKQRNLFAVYRSRALARLLVLRRKLSEDEIADYLYNENRCGIAHGGDIKKYDFGSDFFRLPRIRLYLSSYRESR